MNKDIQTLIEREAKEYMYSEKHSTGHYADVQIEQFKNDSFIDGANLALSLFKWRKVEEEMPEERTDINIKSHGCIYSSRMVRIDDVPIFFISGVSLTVKLEDITEWMPIPQID